MGSQRVRHDWVTSLSLDCFTSWLSIPICSEQTGNELKLQPLNPTQHWSFWRPWGCPTPVQGVPWGWPASICLGICSQRGCHASTCSGIRQSRGVPGGKPALTCLGILSSKGCHTSTCLGIFQSRGPRRLTCLNLPRDPILRRWTCLNLLGDLISRRLLCLS